MNTPNDQDHETAVAEAVMPDWVHNTPEAKTAYMLAMENRVDLDFDQQVMLSRAEYDELKRHLAEVRGLTKVASQGADDSDRETIDALKCRVAALLSGDEYKHCLRALSEAVRVCEDERGSDAPAEEFVIEILNGRPLTPD